MKNNNTFERVFSINLVNFQKNLINLDTFFGTIYIQFRLVEYTVLRNR